MSGTRRRRRRGHPKGKAYGFHGLRPASSTQSTKSSDTGSGDTNSSSTPTSTSGTSS